MLTFPFQNRMEYGGLGALTPITADLETLPLARFTDFKLSITQPSSPNLALSMGVLYQQLNDSEFFDGQMQVYSEGSNIVISGRTGAWPTIAAFLSQLLSIVRSRMGFTAYELRVDVVAPAPPVTEPAGQDDQDDQDDPVDQVDTNDPVGNGDSSGSGDNGSASTSLPSIPSKVFGIPTWLLAVGGAGLLIYKGGSK